jgi:hypothetical protein
MRRHNGLVVKALRVQNWFLNVDKRISMYSCDQSNVYFFKYCNNYYYYTKVKEYFQFFVFTLTLFLWKKSCFLINMKHLKWVFLKKLNKAHWRTLFHTLVHLHLHKLCLICYRSQENTKWVSGCSKIIFIFQKLLTKLTRKSANLYLL